MRLHGRGRHDSDDTGACGIAREGRAGQAIECGGGPTHRTVPCRRSRSPSRRSGRAGRRAGSGCAAWWRRSRHREDPCSLRAGQHPVRPCTQAAAVCREQAVERAHEEWGLTASGLYHLLRTKVVVERAVPARHEGKQTRGEGWGRGAWSEAHVTPFRPFTPTDWVSCHTRYANL